MDTSTLFYVGICAFIAVFVGVGGGIYGPYAMVIGVLALLTIIFIIVLNYADFLVFQLFTLLFGIKQIPAKDYYIPKSNDCIIKYVNGLYYATGYLTASIYNYVFNIEQIQEGEDEAIAEAPLTWERILNSISFPFKYNILAYAMDIQKYRDELEARRGALEFQLSREMSTPNPSQMTIDDLQRRINIVQARIDRLSRGERPVSVVMNIETTAVGVSEKEAKDALASQISHIQTVFSGLDISITRIVGRELYYLFWFNYFLPDKEYLSNVFFSQR